MAAKIKSIGNNRLEGGISHRKPELINKLEGHDSTINAAVLITGEEGVISVSDDRTVRVWLKRDSGQYWPSVCHQLLSEASALDYNSITRRLFVGLDDGTIQEFNLSEDFNSLVLKRTYHAHQSRVTGIFFSLTCEWVLSTSKDKYFQWHCSETGNRLGAHKMNAWCLCLVFDESSKLAFVGDFSGTVTTLKLENTECSYVSSLKGHTGSIQSLAWDVERELLFSASFDENVICWDIGGKQGSAYELSGHRDKVQALAYGSSSRTLFSAANDTSLVIWDMNAKREVTPNWEQIDSCEKCAQPFFWNWKQMWQDKTIGKRQHHCRKCGAAVCDACSSQRSAYPVMGFEYPVRMCDSCTEDITTDQKAPLATTHDAKHRVLTMDLDEPRSRLLTAGADRVIKIWDVSSVLV